MHPIGFAGGDFVGGDVDVDFVFNGVDLDFVAVLKDGYGAAFKGFRGEVSPQRSARADWRLSFPGILVAGVEIVR